MGVVQWLLLLLLWLVLVVYATCLPKLGFHYSWTSPSHLASHRKVVGCREQPQSLHVEPVFQLLSHGFHLQKISSMTTITKTLTLLRHSQLKS